MNATLVETCNPVFSVGLGTPSDDDVRQSVHLLLGGNHVARRSVERRADQRYPFPHLIHLTPVDAQGNALPEQTVVVVGRHLAERGLDFFHAEPLPYRKMIASVEAAPGKWIGLLMDLTWCRFIRNGWYDGGGRFVRVVDSPMSEQKPGERDCA